MGVIARCLNSSNFLFGVSVHGVCLAQSNQQQKPSVLHSTLILFNRYRYGAPYQVQHEAYSIHKCTSARNGATFQRQALFNFARPADQARTRTICCHRICASIYLKVVYLCATTYHTWLREPVYIGVLYIHYTRSTTRGPVVVVIIIIMSAVRSETHRGAVGALSPRCRSERVQWC